MIICVLSFFTIFSEILFILRIIQQGTIINVKSTSRKYPLLL